jgi:hypothetical protein
LAGINGGGTVDGTRVTNIEKRSAQYDEGFPSFVHQETKRGMLYDEGFPSQRHFQTKRVDGSMLKFKLRQPKQPPVTLNQINHLATMVCPKMMVTVQSSVIAQICRVLQEKMSAIENGQ